MNVSESFIPPYDSILPGHYTPEIEIFRGYWLISWFKKEFAQKEVIEAVELKLQPEELLNRRLKEVPAGCDGLVLQPYFTPNLTMPDAKGAVIGLPVVRTQTHEVSGIGSAIPAFVSLGVFKNYKEALRVMVHKKDVFKPNRCQHEIYEKLYEEVYKQIYPKLSGIYAKMSEI